MFDFFGKFYRRTPNDKSVVQLIYEDFKLGTPNVNLFIIVAKQITMYLVF